MMAPLDCDVARDLMPLCLEDVASEKSQAQVTEHIQNCDDCRNVYEDMKKDPPAAPAPAPDEVKLSTAFRKLLRAIRMRHLMWLLIGAVAAAFLIDGGRNVYNRLFVTTWTPIEPKFVQVQMFEMSSGEVLILADIEKGHRFHGFFPTYVPEEGVLYLNPVRPVFDVLPGYEHPVPSIYTSEMRIKDGVMYQGDYEDLGGGSIGDWLPYKNVVKKLRLGTPEDYVVLYQQGDTLQPCSQELEEQFRDRVQ